MGKTRNRKRTAYDHPPTIDYGSKKSRACASKKAFPNKKKADEAADIQTELMGYAYRSYECPFCKKYHLTKQPEHMNKEK